MLSLSTRFLSLLVVLLALSAAEFDLSQQNSNAVSAAPVQPRVLSPHSVPSNPGSDHRKRGRTTKARIGIVVKPGSKVNLSASAVKARSFNTEDQGGVHTLPLTKIRANIQGKEPLMLFQHHLNRANAKLAAIGKRSIPTQAELEEALKIRKESIILQRRGISIGQLDLQSRSIPSLSSHNHQHHFSRGNHEKSPQVLGSPPRTVALIQPSQRKRVVGKHGRLGYTKNAKTGLAGHAKRLVGGLLGGLLGGGDQAQEGPAPVAPVVPATPPPATSSSNDSTSIKDSSSTTSDQDTSSKTGSSASSSNTDGKKGHSEKHHGGSTHSAAASDTQKGYSQVAFQAATSGSLIPANPPAAEDSLGLDIEANDVGYIANIEIGTPLTKFRMLIDSGSADTWVASTACSECGDSHQKLGKSLSSSFKGSSDKFSITYGTGSVSGIVGSDNLSIAGMSLPDHQIGLAHIESKDFSDPSVPFDGLMGLARQQLSNSQVPTPIDSLFAAKLVPAPVMGYHLGRVADGGNGTNDGEVTFGGVDATKFVGDLLEIPNVSTQGFWEGALSGVLMSSGEGEEPKDLGLTNRTAILDTGTTLIVAPLKDADAVHKAIPGSKSDGQGGYYIPCTFNQTLSLAFDGTQFNIDPRDMTFLPVDENNLQGDCVSSISSGQVGQENEWLVGAAFLKNVYFATNTKSNTIGLAKLTKEANTA